MTHKYQEKIISSYCTRKLKIINKIQRRPGSLTRLRKTNSRYYKTIEIIGSIIQTWIKQLLLQSRGILWLSPLTPMTVRSTTTLKIRYPNLQNFITSAIFRCRLTLMFMSKVARDLVGGPSNERSSVRQLMRVSFKPLILFSFPLRKYKCAYRNIVKIT